MESEGTYNDALGMTTTSFNQTVTGVAGITGVNFGRTFRKQHHDDPLDIEINQKFPNIHNIRAINVQTIIGCDKTQRKFANLAF